MNESNEYVVRLVLCRTNYRSFSSITAAIKLARATAGAYVVSMSEKRVVYPEQASNLLPLTNRI